MAQTETPQQTIDRLTAELAAAHKQLEGFKAQQAQASADEIKIREKMAHGLTRDQALSVLKRQLAHDELEKEQKARADAAKTQTPAQDAKKIKPSNAPHHQQPTQNSTQLKSIT